MVPHHFLRFYDDEGSGSGGSGGGGHDDDCNSGQPAVGPQHDDPTSRIMIVILFDALLEFKLPWMIQIHDHFRNLNWRYLPFQIIPGC